MTQGSADVYEGGAVQFPSNLKFILVVVIKFKNQKLNHPRLGSIKLINPEVEKIWNWGWSNKSNIMNLIKIKRQNESFFICHLMIFLKFKFNVSKRIRIIMKIYRLY